MLSAPPSPGATRGAAEERAPAGLGGEPLAGGPAYFLLISSRKPAPCARLRTALGRGESGAPCASRLLPAGEGERAGEGHPGSAALRRREGTPGLLGRFQPSAGAEVWCFSSPILQEKEICGLGTLGREAGGEGPGRGSPSLVRLACRGKAES